MEQEEQRRTILITGATGYIGGRLAPLLLESGNPIRILTRDSCRLAGRPWAGQVDVVEGDVLNPETLGPALEGVRAAYYLIHSMSGSSDFHRRDLRAAENFATAAKAAGVERIIYLGGLGDPESELSEHLRSRQETGEMLRSTGVPVIELRAGIVVGSGSVSFEMVRYLTERLPVMICPRWVYTRAQPIAIRDVLSYLEAALELPVSAAEIIEIGGADVLTYGEMMLEYARERGLNRRLISVPVLTPRLSSYWVHWVTPIPGDIAGPLINGLRNEVIVRSDQSRRLFPQIKPLGYRQAVRRALEKIEHGEVETIWSDAQASSRGDLPPVYFTQEQGILIERRAVEVNAPPGAVFSAFTSLGGRRGWPYLQFAWTLRGLLDRLVGGVGLRRGRRHPDELRAGDALDFWRVESVEQDRLLRLRAEMKVPGKAWLQFQVEPGPGGKTELVQTAFFAPKGLFGLVYWYLLYPIHAVIFSGTVRALAHRAEAAWKQISAGEYLP